MDLLSFETDWNKQMKTINFVDYKYYMYIVQYVNILHYCIQANPWFDAR